MDLFTLTANTEAAVQKELGTYQEELNCLATVWVLERQLLPPFYYFVKPSLYTACRHRWEPSLSPSTWLTPFILPWLFPEILPQLVGPPNPLLVAFPEGLSNLLLWTLLKSLKVLQTQTSRIWPQCVTYLFLSSPQSGTSDCQPQFKAWPFPGTFKHSTNVTIYKSFCSSYQVASSQEQAAVDPACIIVPHKRPKNQHTQWPVSDHTRGPPNQLHKWHTQWVDSAGTTALLKGLSLCGVSLCITAPPFIVMDIPHSQLAQGQSLPLRCPWQSRLNYNWSAYTNYAGTDLQHPAQVTRKTAPLVPTGCTT